MGVKTKTVQHTVYGQFACYSSLLPLRNCTLEEAFALFELLCMCTHRTACVVMTVCNHVNPSPQTTQSYVAFPVSAGFTHTLTFQKKVLLWLWKSIYSKNLGDQSFTTSPADLIIDSAYEEQVDMRARTCFLLLKEWIKKQVKVGLWCFYLVSLNRCSFSCLEKKDSLSHRRLVQYAAASIADWGQEKRVCKSPTLVFLLHKTTIKTILNISTVLLKTHLTLLLRYRAVGSGELVSMLTSVDIAATQFKDIIASKLLFRHILLIILVNLRTSSP